MNMLKQAIRITIFIHGMLRRRLLSRLASSILFYSVFLLPAPCVALTLPEPEKSVSKISLCGVFSKDAASFSRKRIRIVGSSTIFPFSAALSERFGALSDFAAPIVESTGTGGGIHMFCSGQGPMTPDMVNAAREMSISEKKLCEKNSVGPVVEMIIGYDGLVFAAMRKTPLAHLSLTREDLFNALSESIAQDGRLIKNPHKLWSDINPRFPKLPIRVLGAPPTAGSYDVFVHHALKPFCQNNPLTRLKCGQIRRDGAYIAASEHSSVITQKLLHEPNSVGIIGYNFFKQNSDRLQACKVDHVRPTLRTLSNETYPLGYELYLYLKTAHIQHVPGLRAFASSFLQDDASGPHGFLTRLGLVPLTAKQRTSARKNIALAVSYQ